VKAVVWEGSGLRVSVDEVDPRPLGVTDVLVKMTASTVCITDVIGLRLGTQPGEPLPQVPGHGGIGIVEEIGSAVSRVKVGDKVLTAANPYCLKGRPDQCAEIVIASTGPGHTRRSDGRTVYPHSNIGAYAEAAVIPEIFLVPITTSIPDAQLSLLADGFLGGAGAAFNIVPVPAGCTVAVFGCGATGLAYIQAARLCGARRILAVDPLAHRRDAALSFGATETFDPTGGDIVERVKDSAGGYPGVIDRRGVEIAFEASGDHQAIEQAWHVVRPTGDVILASVCHDIWASVSLPAFGLAMSGKRIHGCQYGMTNLLRDIPRYIGLIESGRLTLDGLVTNKFELARVNDALTTVASYEGISTVLELG
jgi:S-(hydroxymethyl)glutathione dehydrogenase/alcohol dehydrogenase